MVTNITRHVVPPGAFTAHPYLHAELTRLDAALAATYAALTGPGMPDPVVTMHTSTLPDGSSRKRYHWGGSCEKYRAVKARTKVSVRMSAMYDRECRSCRNEVVFPDGTSGGLAAQVERHWSLQSLWAKTADVLSQIENGCLQDRLGSLAWSLQSIGRPQVGADVLDAFVTVVTAAYDLTDPTGTFIRDPRNPDDVDNATVEARRTAATVTSSARLAGHFAWTRPAGFLSYEEGQPGIDLDLRALGIPGLHPAFVKDPTQPATVRPTQLAPAYTAWLAALTEGADYTAAAAAARDAYGDLPEPRLSQLPETFPVTRGADQVTLPELLAHWHRLAEQALADVFAEWARSTQTELERWTPLGDVDVVLPGYMAQSDLQTVTNPLARTFPTRYDSQVRAQVVTVPAVIAAWLDRPMTLHRYNLRLVPARQDTAAVIDTFRRLRGPGHDFGRVATARMSVEDALMAARGIHDIPLASTEPGTEPSTTRPRAAHPAGTPVPA